MLTAQKHDAWSAGESYDRYMGRWSSQIARLFLDQLRAPKGADWVELGCGTGALTAAILSRAAPASILATDPSKDFVDHARNSLRDPRVRFETASATDLSLPDASADVVSSGLVLNFVPDRIAALREMQRVLRPGGLVSFYVWDYPNAGIGFIDSFWKAAAAIDPEASALDEAKRFPFCTKEGLAQLCAEAGLSNHQITPIEILCEFPDFDAYWHPFTLGAGPAPGYCQSLTYHQKTALKDLLKQRLGANGAIRLPARAWAMRAQRASE